MNNSLTVAAALAWQLVSGRADPSANPAQAQPSSKDSQSSELIVRAESMRPELKEQAPFILADLSMSGAAPGRTLIGAAESSQAFQDLISPTNAHHRSGISPHADPQVLYVSEKLDPHKPNRVIFLGRSFDDEVMGCGPKGFDQNCSSAVAAANTVVFILESDSPQALIAAHKQAVILLGGLIDGGVLHAHGSPTHVRVSSKTILSRNELPAVGNLSEYYKPEARFLLAACATSGDVVQGINFGQGLANSLGRPVIAPRVPVADAFITSDFRLEASPSRVPGLDPENGEGHFLSANGMSYWVSSLESGGFRLIGVEREGEGGGTPEFKLPSDFNPQAIYHWSSKPSREPFVQVNPSAKKN